MKGCLRPCVRCVGRPSFAEVTIHVSDEAMDVGRTIFSPIAAAIGEVVTTLSPDEPDTVSRFRSDVTATTRSTGSSG